MVANGVKAAGLSLNINIKKIIIIWELWPSELTTQGITLKAQLERQTSSSQDFVFP